MRRFTIVRKYLPSQTSERPPTSPPPAAAYPFGFLSPASSSPEVHPAVGVMRMLASSRTVSAAHSHCFKTLRVSKLKPSARIESFAFSAIGSEPSALLRLPASRALSVRWRTVTVSSSGPVPAPVLMPPSVSCSMRGLRPSVHLTRSADTLAVRAELRSSLIGSKTSSLLRRSLYVVPSRTSVPEMIQVPQHPGYS